MCFDLTWFEHLLIWLIIICGIVALGRLLLPIILGWLGMGISGVVMQVINIILVVVVLIVLVVICFDIFSCLLGSGGGFSLSPRR